jgi:cell division transport system permease protein
MKTLKFWRTLSEGWKNFTRNGWLSLATVSVLVLSLYVISITVALGVAAHLITKDAQDKVNISIYFNSDVQEERILEIQDKLNTFHEIQSIEYVSQNQALDQLLEAQKENTDVQKALDELGFNPLKSSLVIKAHELSQYETINAALELSEFYPLMHKINFNRNKEIIERFDMVINVIEKVGLSLGIVFVFIAVLITYNTIRLTLYSHRHEFEIMRLVGASNLYIKMPSMFEGMLYGIFAALTTLILMTCTMYFASSVINISLEGKSIFMWYLSQSWKAGLTLLGMGIILGVVSSWIAIKKYLKI